MVATCCVLAHPEFKLHDWQPCIFWIDQMFSVQQLLRVLSLDGQLSSISNCLLFCFYKTLQARGVGVSDVAELLGGLLGFRKNR